jgi:hypothetical protein
MAEETKSIPQLEAELKTAKERRANADKAFATSKAKAIQILNDVKSQASQDPGEVC